MWQLMCHVEHCSPEAPALSRFLRDCGEEFSMLSKCANALCNTPFRRLSDGKLFLLQGETDRETLDPKKGKPPHRVEYFWLCGDCARLLTLTFTSTTGVATVPLAPGTTLSPRPASAHATAGRQREAGMLAHAGGYGRG